MSLGDICKHNWGFTPATDPGFWDVDDDTYINGVPVIIDHDLRYGYLLEVIERDTLTLSYVVVVRHSRGHESAWYEPDAGTIRNPNVEYHTVAAWATETIYSLFDEEQERSKRPRRNPA
jgi:hypothetical protein